MPTFRAYTISKNRQVTVAPPVVIVCENDQDGLQQARQLVGEDEIELWDGPRFIARLKPSQESPPQASPSQASKEPH
jgi:hypothetical protein